MRLGIVDVERWRQSLEPSVLEDWMRFARIEPEWFQAVAGGTHSAASSKSAAGEPRMLPASKAGAFFARKYG